ncbi:unnamed protein product [Arabidopsis halleri]
MMALWPLISECSGLDRRHQFWALSMIGPSLGRIGLDMCGSGSDTMLRSMDFQLKTNWQ